MVEPKRAESAGVVEGNNRDNRIEALLVDGLDCYFAGKYEDAIHLWTRVLFLDRSHARARAYIDRARGALAERQRQTEEMLHATSALLAEGQTAQARDLLTRAVAAYADEERASALRDRLERLERAGVQPHGPVPPHTGGTDGGALNPLRRFAVRGALAIIIAATVAGLVMPDVVSWVGRVTRDAPLSAVAPKGPLPTLSTAETALLRARTYYAHGRLAEALVALDRVGAQSGLRPDADRLRMEIQQVLLASGKTQDATP